MLWNVAASVIICMNALLDGNFLFVCDLQGFDKLFLLLLLFVVFLLVGVELVLIEFHFNSGVLLSEDVALIEV